MDFELPEFGEVVPVDQSHLVSMPNTSQDNLQTLALPDPLTWFHENSAPAQPSPPTPPSQPPNRGRHQPLPRHEPQQKDIASNDAPAIDISAVEEMGSLAYAKHCREQARMRYKEIRKNEHKAKGNHKFVTRLQKGDTSLTHRQRQDRRLGKNRDSASASRLAHEVYVKVLETLVSNGDEQKNALRLQLKRIHEENSQLRQQNSALTAKVSHLEDVNNNSNFSDDLLGLPGDGRYDSLQVAKHIDLVTSPEQVSAQAQDRDFAEGRMGIQPSRAV